MEPTTIQQDLWELAFVVALERLGLVPPRKADGKRLAVAACLEQMDPAEARKSKRRYRKLWRRNLAREFREFEKVPRRRKKEWRYSGAYIEGRWQSCEDPLDGILLKTQSTEAGERPSFYARCSRWAYVRESKELRKAILKAAAELGLLHPKRSI